MSYQVKYYWALAGWFLAFGGLSLPYVVVLVSPRVPLPLLLVSVWCALLSVFPIFHVLLRTVWDSFFMLEVRNATHVIRNVRDCALLIGEADGIQVSLQSGTAA